MKVGASRLYDFRWFAFIYHLFLFAFSFVTVVSTFSNVVEFKRASSLQYKKTRAQTYNCCKNYTFFSPIRFSVSTLIANECARALTEFAGMYRSSRRTFGSIYC